MGSVGLSFPITQALDAVWGYTPSIESMRALLDIFAYDRSLVNDELAELRYRASIQPGFQECFAAMFPAPRQRWVDALASPEEAIRAIPHETLVIHGREDKVIPLSVSQRLARVDRAAHSCMFTPVAGTGRRSSTPRGSRSSSRISSPKRGKGR